MTVGWFDQLEVLQKLRCSLFIEKKWVKKYKFNESVNHSSVLALAFGLKAISKYYFLVL